MGPSFKEYDKEAIAKEFVRIFKVLTQIQEDLATLKTRVDTYHP